MLSDIQDAIRRSQRLSMRSIYNYFPAAGLILSAAFLLPLTAQARYAANSEGLNAPPAQSIVHKTQFRISQSKTVTSLEERGYSDIVVEKHGLSKVVAVACKDGERLRLTLSRSMKIRRKERIGYCRDVARGIKRNEVVDFLETSGFNKVVIVDERASEYVAEACEGRRKFSLTIGRNGAITSRRPSGTCEPEIDNRRAEIGNRRAELNKGALVPRQALHILKRRGFDQIVFFDSTPPEYGAEACRDGALFEVTVNRSGRILSQDRIGRCDDAPRAQTLTPEDAKDALRQDGFDSIKIVETRERDVVAEACRNGRRFRLTVDEKGAVSHGDFVGRCNAGFAENSLNARDIRRDLRARGFNRIHFLNRTPPVFKVEACRMQNRVNLRIDQRGNVMERRVVGRCNETDKAPGYVQTDIEDILERRNYYDVKLHEKRLYEAEVCRHSRKFRLTLDRFGNEIQRKRLGWCRSNRQSNLRPDRRFASRNWISENEVMGRGRVAPSTCQDYIEWLLENNSITFETASAEITSESRPLLKRLAHVANRCPSTTIEIAGHTDSDGSPEANQRLSERRAESVVRYLLQHNVERNRLTAAGYGETQPLVPNDTPWNKALNRRIEFVVQWAGDWRYSERDTN